MFSLLALLVDKDNDKILCIFKTLQHLTFRCLDYWRCWLIKTKTRFCAYLNFTTLNFQMSRLLALLVDKDKDKDKILCIFKTLQNFQMSRLLALLVDKDKDKILCIFKTLQHLTFRCLDC